MNHVTIGAFLLAILALGPACGGGGGGGGPESVPGMVVVDGWWEYLVRESDSGGDYEQLFIIPLWQTGSQVDFYGVTLTREGMSVTGAFPDFASAMREEFHFSIRSATLIEGQCVSYRTGPEPTYRDVLLSRVPAPDGRLTAYGTAWNGPLDVTISTAYAVKIALGTPSIRVGFAIVDLAGEGRSELYFEQPQWSASDTYDLARYNGQFLYHEVSDAAVAGTLTRLRADPGRISGIYTMTMGDGRTISGQFNAPILLER